MANKVSSECSTTQADDLPGNHHNPKTPTKQVPTDENAAFDIECDDKEEDGGPPLVKLTKKCRQQTAYDKKDEKHFLRTLTNISDNFYYTDEDSLRRNGLPTLPSNGSASSTDIEGWKDGVEEVTRGGSSGGKRGKVGGSFRKPRSKGEHRKIGNENFKFEFYNDPRRYLKQYKRFHSCTGQATKLRQNEAIPLDYPDMSYNVWDRAEATFPLKLDAITREGGSVLMKVGRGNLITAPLVSASNVLVLQQKIQPPPSPQHNDQNSKSLENKKSKEQKLLLGPPFPHRISARSSSPTTPHSLTELLKVQHNSTDGVVSSNSLPPQAKQNQYIKKRQDNSEGIHHIRRLAPINLLIQAKKL